MKVDIHMRDGRTVHRLARRGDFIELVKRKPSDLDTLPAIAAHTRWQVDDGFIPSRLMYIAAGAVAQVAVVPPEAAGG